MKWIICGIAVWVAAALAACNSQPAAREPAIPSLVAAPPASPKATAPMPAKAQVATAGSAELADSLRAFVGVRPMQFRSVADSLQIDTPTVARRFIVIHELFQTPHILYRSAANPGRWFQFKLEPVGEAGTVGGTFTVDTVVLDPQRQTLLLHLEGHNGFWGGSSAYGQTAIVDVTAEPLLLFKTEVLNENVSYGRDSDTVYDDDAAGSESQSQEVSIRNQRIVVGPPQQTNQQGRTGELLAATIRPTPKSMLPAGRYRYQNGRLVRVGK